MSDMIPITLKSDIFDRLSDEEFRQFCLEHRDLRIERNANGEIVIMPPTFSKTGRANARVIAELLHWNDERNGGEVFDSSTGFALPNGAVRSPDASWVSQERWDALPEEAQEGFARICPDFVVEIKSQSDRLESLSAKMQEYLAHGTRLGWLIDLEGKKVHVFRPEKPVEVVESFDQPLSADPELPGFQLDLGRL